MTRQTVLITGTNRGLGYALAAKLLSEGKTVYACARNPDGARELWELERDYGDRCKIVALDVADERSVHDAAASLRGAALDILINNAGVYPERDGEFARLREGSLLKAFTVNTVGPIRVTQALLPNLQKAPAPVVATISSKMGSIADNTSGGEYAYRISKAAVNMFNRSFAADFPKITAVVLHPGWVQTDMGGRSAPTTVDESVAGLANVINHLSLKDSGKFIDFRGAELPW